MLGLDHDDRCWLMVDELGNVVHRNDTIALDDRDAADDWAHSIITARPGYLPPAENPTTGARYFAYNPTSDVGTGRDPVG